MSLVDQVRLDIECITENLNDFGQNMNITNGTDSIDVVGFHTKHHTAFDIDGAPVNVKIASVSVTEKQFVTASYPYRDSDGDVYLHDNIVTVKDSTGDDKTYTVRENYADEYVGLIILILGEYVSD